jgi:alkylation response protein AidB-like acyl-CoA dehydrogenase
LRNQALAWEGINNLPRQQAKEEVRQSATTELDQLREVVRDFLAAEAAMPAVRRAMSAGYDRRLWRGLAAEIGLAGLAVPAEFGGAGCGLREVAVVCAELGRALTPAPYLSTAVLAVGAILASGDRAAAARLLPAICSGDTVAAVVIGIDPERLPRMRQPSARGVRPPGGDEPGLPGRGLLTGAAGRVVARGDGRTWTLDGAAGHVIDGHLADVLVVVAEGPDGPVCAEVSGTAAGLGRGRLAALDQTRELAAIDFRGVPAAPIAAAGGERAAPAAAGVALRVAALGAAALASEQAAGAARCLELAAEHARHRVQFGRPIGSFQAIKHKLADMLLAVESARSAAWHAAWAADHEPETFGMYASLAKAYCSEAYLAAAGECIQIHGGIGVTWEHDAHLYFKRATADAILFGGATQHRARLAPHAGLP